jgi:TRAP-type uncharacterized transport system substrate-binding protein
VEAEGRGAEGGACLKNRCLHVNRRIMQEGDFMRSRGRERGLFVTLLAVALMGVCLGPGLHAEDRTPVDVVFMTTPFGTHMYSAGAAAEQVFKKAGSWVRVKHQETPGAMYMYRYMVQNLEKMKSGEVPHTVVVGGPPLVDFLAEGRRPFDDMPWPTVKALVPIPAVMGLYATFDPEIQTLKDLAGRRVCTGERSRPFQGVLLDKPLFGSMGIYEEIKWSPLGAVGCKDAFLNGSVDVIPLRFMGLIEVGDDGVLFAPKCAGGPATMEIINSGRELHFIPMTRKQLGVTKKIPGALVQHPIVFKKGAFEGLDHDVMGRAGPNGFLCDASLPDEVAAEIVRVWNAHRNDFAKYDAMLGFMPRTPYPVGAEAEEAHPAVVSAMEEMGLPIPNVQ